jgi:transcriptional regulator with XRE-family HTH domain
MTLSEKLARNLKARRGNLTQDEFARRLGISRATLNRLENASQNTTLKTLDQISSSLRCDVGELFGEIESAPN